MKALDNHRARLVLRYWFDGASDTEAIGRDSPCYQRWFAGGAVIDAEIRTRFADDMTAARAGACATWTAPDEVLALVLLLDQVPRHVYRADARAFASDDAALALARRCIADGSDEQLGLVERVFLYLPIQHSECIADHDLARERYEQLAARARERGLPVVGFLDGGVQAEREHLDLLRRFGRYPGRNAASNRISTPAERAYLDEHT